MTAFDLVITNGIVVDGAGNARRRGDVAVRNGMRGVLEDVSA